MAPVQDWLSNLSAFAAAATVLRDGSGREVVVVVAKATFTWDREGTVRLATDQRPLVHTDVFGTDGAGGLLIAPSDLTLAKPRVDVLVQGEIVLARPVESVDIGLDVGGRIRKVVAVHGERVWTAGALGPVPTRPVRFTRMPLTWECAFGGSDPRDPANVDRVNPAGVGYLGKQRSPIEGARLPNFELLGHPDAKGEARAAGFGPIAPHWKPRADLAGTYDERWKALRSPLLPDDFDARYHNVAPSDQQLDEYLPAEEVRLVNMTPAGTERFRLPHFDCPITLIDDGYLLERRPRVDTMVIEPATRTLALTTRLVHVPRRDLLSVKAIFVGRLSSGRRRALTTGKHYLTSRHSRRPQAAPTPGAYRG